MIAPYRHRIGGEVVHTSRNEIRTNDLERGLIMTIHWKLIGAAAAAAALTGCVETGGGMDTGLSGTDAQFDSMVYPCTAQASRMTGASQSSIAVLDRIQTGGGPILTLSAAGAKYTCRLEDDGSVTVFSEFAN